LLFEQIDFRRFHQVNTTMHENVEVRGNSIRISFRYQGERCREPIPGDPTPANLENAARLVGLIRHEIAAGTFSYARHFPNSSKVKTNTFGHFIDLWLNIKRNEMAPSGLRVYEGRAELHIRPKWGHLQADQIDHLDLQEWVQTELMPKLHNKTVNEIIGLVRQIFRLYRMRNRMAHDPTEGLRVRVPDRDDPDPFDRREIDAILSLNTEREQERNLAQFMIWAGPRVSEAISLAWEDVVDLDKGIVRFQRSQVRGHYKVTKTRRSVREVKLLRPAREALQAQVKFTEELDAVTVDIKDRDNKTTRRRQLRFVFHNSTTKAAHTSSDMLLKGWWRPHLKAAGVRFRGPNNCRHTFASQLLTTGAVPLEWIADQMGHTSTDMIRKHYGKWINDDGPDMVGILEHALKL